MQSVSVSVNNVSSKSTKTVALVSVVPSKNTSNSVKSSHSNDFYWDDVMDESFSKDIIDANGNLI